MRVFVLVGALTAGAACERESQADARTSSTPAAAGEIASAPSATAVASVVPTPVEVPREVPPPWCGRVTIPMLSEAEEQRLADEFRRRNPSASTAIASASSSHYISHALAYRPKGDPPALDEASAIAAARKLVEKNADLLGFTAAELRGADATTRRMMDRLWVDLRRDIPRQGYERFPTVARKVAIRIMFGGGMALSSSAPLPDFKLCLEAPLPATSPKVAEGAIRQWVPMRGSHWSPTAADITGIEPTIFIERNERLRTITLTRAYEVKIGEMDSAFVDASSGVPLGWRRSTVESNAPGAATAGADPG